MKKTLIKITKRVVLMILILSLALTGCAQGEEGFELGFTSPLIDHPNVLAAVKSTSKLFDLDSVEIEFSFGIECISGIIYEQQHGKYYETAKLYFVNDEGTEYFIKNTEDIFTSETYNIYANDGRFDFNHSEIFKIPPHLFEKETGRIDFEVRSIDLNSKDSKCKTVTSVYVFYKKTKDGKVALDIKPFEQSGD